MEQISNMDEEYEQEQIQQILLQESEKKKIEMDRELKESQDKEYQDSLKRDLQNSNTDDEYSTISIEEMRRIRLIRFDIN